MTDDEVHKQNWTLTDVRYTSLTGEIYHRSLSILSLIIGVITQAYSDSYSFIFFFFFGRQSKGQALTSKVYACSQYHHHLGHGSTFILIINDC